MFIRRLSVEEDFKLFREVYRWDRDYPRWYKDAEKVARLKFRTFIEQAKERADIGVFDPEFTGLISVIKRTPEIYEGHVWARRKTSVETLAWAVFNVRESLEKELGMRAAYVWVVKRNRPVRKLCTMAGLMADGAKLIDGESHGKPITWVRHIYGKAQNHSNDEQQPEHELRQYELVRLHDCAGYGGHQSLPRLASAGRSGAWLSVRECEEPTHVLIQ
jgi:hypothetical protein